MSKYLDKCEACKQERLIEKRMFRIPHVKGVATSQSLLCDKCASNIEKMMGAKLLQETK